MLKAAICTIGDEILIGQIVDTNSSAIAAALQEAGVKVDTMLSVGDSSCAIKQGISSLLKECDIVLTTGGLGPTKDDITKKTLAELSGSGCMKRHEGQLSIIQDILVSKGLAMLDVNIAQADVPDTCEVIVNKKGTAPIMIFRFGADSEFGHECTAYILPGVPFEAMGALPDVIEDIHLHNPGLQKITHRNIMTYGLAESALAKLIEPWEDALSENVHLAYLPNFMTGVKLRLSIYGGNEEENKKVLDAEIEKLASIAGEYIYSYDERSLQEEIGKLLKESGKTLSCAESCTGGSIAASICSVPGASTYFLGSVTAYSVLIKENVLGIEAEKIEKYGVVSEEVAIAMAEGVRKLTGSDFSVATTGVAGPGDSDGVPEGTVCIGFSSAERSCATTVRFRNGRNHNIQRFTASALNFLRTKARDIIFSLKLAKKS